jgi:hypothetical protein
MIRLENRVLLAVPAAVLAFALLAAPLLVQPRTAVVQPSYATLPVVDESTVRNLPTYSETLRAADGTPVWQGGTHRPPLSRDRTNRLPRDTHRPAQEMYVC